MPNTTAGALLSRISLPTLVMSVILSSGNIGAQELPVIPHPVKGEWKSEVWRPEYPVRIVADPAVGADLIDLAVTIVGSKLRGGAQRSESSEASGGVRLRIDRSLDTDKPVHYIAIGTSGVDIRGSSEEALFHGLQTLRQLLAAADTTGARVERVSAVEIEDYPRFGYRGLHLDMGRHFQPVAFVKRYIDLMSRYKLNTFHWHLTEDQGWRIEIKKYPRLTEVGGCRAETMVARNFSPYVGDGVPHCGFYTQDEVREVVAYAAARHITVIPEIEMPGHTVAALAAYPELACTPGPFAVRTTWGVDENILCPSEETFRFLEDVLTEVIDLFPSTLIHIGGDEAPKKVWEESSLAQEVIRREGLKDEHELQSWFIRRIERFLNSRGRRLIGWDEILEGGLAPNATVMSWRGVSGGIEAARQGRDVVMTPTSHLYLDYYQGDSKYEPLAIGGLVTLEQVYSFEPVPSELTAAEALHILGAQGNVWTEYLKTPESVEYMVWPRALALAEVVWSPVERRSWDSFVLRLPHALDELGSLGVNYRLPHVEGLDGDMLTLDSVVTVTLSSPVPGSVIRYTLDGSEPDSQSLLYTAPLTLSVPEHGLDIAARAVTADGRMSPVRGGRYTRTRYRDGLRIDAASLRSGLKMEYFEAAIDRVAAIDTLQSLKGGIVSAVARQGDEREEQYALRFTGYMVVPEDALYAFALVSDDGSTFSIGGARVIDHDGLHGPTEKQGMVALRAGVHPMEVRFFQAGGGAALSLRYRTGTGMWNEIPASWLRHPN